MSLNFSFLVLNPSFDVDESGLTVEQAREAWWRSAFGELGRPPVGAVLDLVVTESTDERVVVDLRERAS